MKNKNKIIFFHMCVCVSVLIIFLFDQSLTARAILLELYKDL